MNELSSKAVNLRVVFDTNVYISAFAIPKSRSEEAFRYAYQGKILLIASPAIIAETVNKLREKFDLPEDEIQIIIRLIAKVSIIVKPTNICSLLSDEADNRILECTSEGKANLIITGDKHLLKIKSFEGIGIARVNDLLRTMGLEKE